MLWGKWPIYGCSVKPQNLSQDMWKGYLSHRGSGKTRTRAFAVCTHNIWNQRKLMPYANNKGADQPAHLRSLISTFVVRCLDSIIFLFYIRNFKHLASCCGCAGQFESYLVANPKTGFLVTRLIYVVYGTRGSFRQRATSLTPLSGCDCTWATTRQNVSWGVWPGQTQTGLCSHRS